MALRITRAVDSKLFGGFDLDSSDLEGTSDHIIWVRKVSTKPDFKYAVFNITSGDQTLEVVLESGQEFSLMKNVSFELTGVQEHWADTQPFCEYCGRGDTKPKRLVPQARLGLTAPREYKFLRHDARKK